MILPPSLILFMGAILLLHSNLRVRQCVMLLLPLVTLGCVWSITAETNSAEIALAGFQLVPVFLHDYTRIFATGFCLALFAGCIFAIQHHKRAEMPAVFLLAGAAIGICFAGDLITLLLYWEIMAIGSTLVVFSGGTASARRAALRYAYMHLFGGVLLLTGIVGYIPFAGDALLSSIKLPAQFPLNLLTENDPSSLPLLLILAGVLVNAAAWPFSAWLPDSYPQATPAGSVFLATFTTKTSVFVLLTLFHGTAILIPIGLVMVFYGILYAMLENNIRRILSYSIVNQVGMMVVGIGIGSPLAMQAVASHAFCHILYKSLLMMSAGSVVTMTGRNQCTELGGLYHTMRITALCGIIGALSISAFPLTNGFISKPLISEAAADAQLGGVWFLLLAANAGVFLHAGIKFPWFVFFQKDSGLRPKDAPLPMKVAMLFLSALCIVPAFYPPMLYALLPGEIKYDAYTMEHLVTQMQLLLFSALAFFVVLQFTPLLKRTETLTLDTDWLYRVPLRNLLLLAERLYMVLWEQLMAFGLSIGKKLARPLHIIHAPGGIASRHWALGSSLLYAVALLGLSLLFYLFK